MTITGSNDAPQITTNDVIGAVTEDTSTVANNPNTTGAVETGAFLTNTGSISFSDGDSTDLSAATVALTSAATSSAAAISTDLATALASAVALSGATAAANNGTVNWSFALDNSLVQYLAAGETVTATYTITIRDDSGTSNASNTQSVTVTITGTNDAPVVTNSATVRSGSVREAGHIDNGVIDNGMATVSGTLTASDVDTGAIQRWSFVGSHSTTYGAIAIDTATGVWTYTLNNNAASTQALDEGEVVTQTYTARVTDDFGASADQTITVTITGSNDLAQLSTATTGPMIISNPRLPGDVPLAPDLVLSDVDQILFGASVTLHDAASGDILNWTVPAGASALSVSSSWVPATTDVPASRVLSITGNAVPAVYQELLRSITYTSSSTTPWRRDPAVVASSRTDVQLTWTVDDGYANPVMASSSLRFINLNPEISGGNIYLIGSTNPLPIDPSLQLSDPDSTQLASALVKIEQHQAGDLLSWNTDFASSKGLLATFDEFAGELTIIGVADVSDYQALLQTVTYVVDWSQTSNPSSVSSTRSIAWQVVDANDDERGHSTSDHYRNTVHISSIASGPAPNYSSSETIQEDNGTVSTTGPLTVLPALPLFSTNTKTLTANGQLSIVDQDFDQDHFSTSVSDWPGIAEANIGSLQITASGSWVYTLDNTHPLIQALPAGEQRIESFMVQSLDGTARQRIDITINGCDDIISQYASQVLRMSSQGKDPESDLTKRWYASQSLGAPNSVFGDSDTAWSPRRKNSDGSNGRDADEFIQLGYSRSVKATGVRIYETAGLGFVREVWGILDTPLANGNTAYEYLWSGVDNASVDSRMPGVLELNFAPSSGMINGLLILVDIDNTDFWEQIDSVELIGIAKEKTYRPETPTIDKISEDNIINLSDKTTGVLISGGFDPYGSTNIEVTWGGKTHNAEININQGSWWVTLSGDDVPDDTAYSSIEVRAIDRSDPRSGDHFSSDVAKATVSIDTLAPTQPLLAVVAEDDIVNSYEKYERGVTLSGSAEPLSKVEIAWDYKNPRIVQADSSGNWSLSYTSVFIPVDSDSSHIVVTAIDNAGNRSNAFDHTVLIDTMAPSKVLIDSVNYNNTINLAQKLAGVRITGTAEFGSSVNVEWQKDAGTWITKSTIADLHGVYGVATADSTIYMHSGSTILGTVNSGSTGEFLYILSPDNVDTLSQLGALNKSMNATWRDTNQKVKTTTFAVTKGLWLINYSADEVPADGSKTRIEASATDSQGNLSRITSDFVLVDTIGPSIPILKVLDIRLNAADLLNTLIVKGSAEIGSSLVLNLLGEMSSARAGSGSWTAHFSPDQLDRIRSNAAAGNGPTVLTIQAFDSFGNGSVVFSQEINIDSVAPFAPVFNLPFGTYINAADRVSGFMLTGTSEVGSSIEIQWEQLTRTVITDKYGFWTISILPTEIPLDTTTSVLTAVAIDTVGNRSKSANLSFVIDSIAPNLSINVVGSADGILSTASGYQQVSGTAEPLQDLTLWVGGSSHSTPILLASTKSDARGVFNLTLSLDELKLIGEGNSLYLFAKQSDLAGNSSVSSYFPCSVDLTSPIMTISILGGKDQIISSQVDDASLSGTAEPGRPLIISVTGSFGTRKLGVITSDNTGSFVYYFNSADLAALGQGNDFILSLQQADHAGNSSTVNVAFTIDTISPSAPVIIAAGGLDKIISGALLDRRVEGLAGPNDLVSFSLFDANGKISDLGSTYVDLNGTFNFDLSDLVVSKLPQGSGFQVVATTRDTAGNTASSRPYYVSIDTIGPTPPTISTIGGSDSIITSVISDQSIKGMALPYSTISLMSDVSGVALTLGSVNADGKGSYEYILSESNIALLGQGLRHFWAVTSDVAGNQSSSSVVSAVVDTVADSIPTIHSAGGIDNIISSNYSDQVIMGTAVAGRAVTLKANITSVGNSLPYIVDLGTVTPDINGNYLFQLTSRNLQDLSQSQGVLLVASQTDLAGNLGISEPFVFNLDTIALDVPVISSVGGLDSIVTSLEDSIVIGKAIPDSLVSFLFSNDGIAYQALSTAAVNSNGVFSYQFSQADINKFQQSTPSFLIAQLVDSAGNISNSYPFSIKLDTLSPASPIISGLTVVDTVPTIKLSAAGYATGLTLSGTAIGAKSVEIKIGSNAISQQAYVNTKGNWSITIPSSELPSSKISSTTSLQAIARNSNGLASTPSQVQFLYDTSRPSILDVVNEGSTVRIVFDELIVTPPTVKDSKFILRSGSRSIVVKSLASKINSLGNSEILLQLSESLPSSTVVKLSYLGSVISDHFGNKLSQFSNFIVTSLASSQSIASPGYSYVNLALTGDSNANVTGNDYDNFIAGNVADNILEGGAGVDVITGGTGRDTFKYSNFVGSLLSDPITGKAAYDRITDFAIGSDIVDAPYAVRSEALLRISSSLPGSLDAKMIQSLLPSDIFEPYGAAVITLTETNKTFLVLNNGNRGFLSSQDIFIDITGFSGSINNLSII